MNLLKNIPALKFTIIFIAGIIIGSTYIFDLRAMLASIIVILILTFILLCGNYNEAVLLSAVSILIFLSGIYKSNLDFFCFPENSIKHISDTKKNSSVILTGIIKDLPDCDTNRIRFVLESHYVISGTDTLEVTGEVISEVRKNIYSKEKIRQPVLNAGDEVTLTGKLSVPSFSRNPGEFDYKNYLELQGIYKVFYANGYNDISVSSKNNLNFFYTDIVFPVKVFVLNEIDKNYSGDEAAFLKGLITGERSDVSNELKTVFVDAGVMHLIAVSGLNVAYIIISITLILSLIRIPQKPRVAITISFLVFYCFFTGNSASILRATVMGIVVLIAFIIERRIIFYNVIGLAGMLLLIYDTRQLYDAGFILSFSATISMVVFFGKFESLFINKVKELNIRGKKITLLVIVLFLTSLSAQIGTIPITAGYFGKVSLISIVANVIAVPLSNISLAVGFLEMVIASFSGYLSEIISEANNFLLQIQLIFIKWCASLDFAFIYVKSFDLTDIISFYLMLITLLTIRKRPDIISRLVIILLIISGRYVLNLDFENKLRVIFMDVGQGDCSIIKTPEGRIIMTDCGRTTFTSSSGQTTIIPYLRRIGINKIDLLIITHLHLDHIGGINDLLKNIEVTEIIESGQKHNTQFTKTMDSLICIKKIRTEITRSGDMITNIKDVRLYFVFPDNKFVDEKGNTYENNLNNGSAAFILKYGSVKFFFSGDIEKESEEFICSTYQTFLKTDVLKVAHHGSKTSSTAAFLELNKPQYSVISCGVNNKFNHPSEITLKKLEDAGSNIYRTDLEGAVIIETNGKIIDLIHWK